MLKMLSRGLLCFLIVALAPAVHAQDEAITLDEEFARLAEQVPGFGGLYLDEEGTTHVYLQDLSRARDVQDLGERVEVHQGQYDFRDLFAWKEVVRPWLAREGAVSLDIDERRNRLAFGVERGSLDAFTAELQSFLRNTRVPPEAVIAEPDELSVPLETVRDRIRPVPGGVKIQTANGTCTLGVNATRLGVKGFVTASHCTATRSVVEGTQFFQNVTGTINNFIGTETADPPFFTNSSNSACPSGKKCRYSDAAFIAYDSAAASEGGQIANPILCGLGIAGSLAINPAQPRLPVTAFMFGSPLSGSVITKVGERTSCTFGAQTNTCMDRVVGKKVGDQIVATDMVMLCQNRVSGFSLGGDSGSPVFRNFGTEVTLVGILWGGSESVYSYSPWLFVHGELGGVMPDAP